MQIGTLVWSYAKGEGSTHINKEFAEMHYVVKLDAIVDWIADLQKLYEDTIEKKHAAEAARKAE